MRTPEELMGIAADHLWNITESAVNEYGYWDGLVESDELTDEECDWIQDNLEVIVEVVQKD